MKPYATTVLVFTALVAASVYAVDDDDVNSGIRTTSSLTARQTGLMNDFSNMRFRNPAFLRAQNFGVGASDSLSSLGVQSGSMGVQPGLLGSQSLLSGFGGANSGLLGSQLQGNQLLLSGGQFGTGLDSFGLQSSLGLNNGLGGFNSGFNLANQNRFPTTSSMGFGNNALGFNSQFSNPLLNNGVGSSSLLGLQQGNLGLNNGQFSNLGLNNGQFGSLGLNNGQFGSLGLNNGQFGSLGLNNGQFGSLGLNNGQFSSMGLNNGQFGSMGLNNGQFNTLGFNNGQLGSSLGFNNGQLGLNNGLFNGVGANGQFGSSLGFNNGQSGLNNGMFNGLGANSQLGFNNSPFGTSTGLNTLPFNQQSMLFNQNANLGLGLGSNLGLGSSSLGLGTNNVRQFRELDSTKNDRTIFNNDMDDNMVLSRPRNGSNLNLNPNGFRQPFANSAFPLNANPMEANGFFNPLLSQLNANQGLRQGAFPNQQGNTNTGIVNDIRTLVPGQPNQDYPTFQSVPETGFSCQGRQPGYYADSKTRCQAFHICGLDANGGNSKNSFLCPNGTLFNQVNKVCQWWAEVDCSKSEQHFGLNENDSKMPMTTLPPVQTLPSPNFGFQQQPTPFPNILNGAQFLRPFTNSDVSSNNGMNNRQNQNADQLNTSNEKPLFAPPHKRPPFRPSFRPASGTDV